MVSKKILLMAETFDDNDNEFTANGERIDPENYIEAVMNMVEFDDVNFEIHRISYRIAEIKYDYILFTNGDKITFYHGQDCCEKVYANFQEIDDIAMDYEFNEPLVFEEVKDYGFRFGNKGKMVSVPCYNVQNGYYSDDLDILLNKVPVITDCELKDEIY